MPDVFYNILLVFGLAAIWISLAPTQLGGQVSYVMVNGNSMEPNYHTGDLIIFRQAEEYQVGDFVVYHDPLLVANIIHRIVALDQDRFIIKGDNNSWNDAYHPTRLEIGGKRWIYLPKLGPAIRWIRTPIYMALASGLIGGLFMINMTMQEPKKKEKRKKVRWPFALSETALYIVGAVVLGFLALTIYAFIRPLERTADNIPYTQTGSFFYSAAGTSSVYDTGAARSGEPVFLNLTCTLNSTFSYTLQGEQLENIAGFRQFYAVVQDEQSGWQRTIPLTSDTTFTGKSYTGTAALNLCQLEDLVSAVEKETGIHSSTYTLVVTARVNVGGEMSGQHFSDTFESHLTFRFDSLHFYLVGNPSTTDPLQTVQSGSLKNSAKVANTLNLLGLKPVVLTMRKIAGSGLAISLGVLLALAIIFYDTSSNNKATAIGIKYGSFMMDIYDQKLGILLPVIDVTTIEDLAKLAERQNAMIMHLIRRDSVHYYLVQSGGTIYRYVSNKG